MGLDKLDQSRNLRPWSMPPVIAMRPLFFSRRRFPLTVDGLNAIWTHTEVMGATQSTETWKVVIDTCEITEQKVIWPEQAEIAP